MAVGLIVKCEKCGKSYDSGKTRYIIGCDGGAALAAEQRDLDEFNRLSIEQRLELIYKRLRAFEKDVNQIPYSGPIG